MATARGGLIISNYNKLPVGKIVFAALSIAYERRKALTRALVVPFVALTLALFSFYIIAWQTDIPSYMYSRKLHPYVLIYLAAYYLIYSVAFAPFAIPCHRIVLLGPSSIASGARWRWTRRETRFALSLTQLFATSALVMMVLLFVWAFLTSAIADLKNPQAVSYLGPILAIAAGSYVFSRLSIIFPSIAIDEPLTIRSAWQMSRGNGWRLLIIVVIFFYVQKAAQTLVHHESLLLASMALVNVLAIFGIVALSLSYSELRKNIRKR